MKASTPPRKPYFVPVSEVVNVLPEVVLQELHVHCLFDYFGVSIEQYVYTMVCGL